MKFFKKNDKSKIEDNIERFLGRLSKPQRELVATWIQKNPPNKNLRVENRRHILKELDSKMNPWTVEAWSQTVLDWLKNVDGRNLPEYKEYVKKRTDSVVELLVSVLKIMSDEQRKNLKSNLLDFQSKLATN